MVYEIQVTVLETVRRKVSFVLQVADTDTAEQIAKKARVKAVENTPDDDWDIYDTEGMVFGYTTMDGRDLDLPAEPLEDTED